MNDYILDFQKYYYSLISWDHHKDRDCHINIGYNTQYSYGNIVEKNVYVLHNGYLNEFEGYFDTIEEGEDYTINELIKMIEHVIDITKRNDDVKYVNKFEELVENFKKLKEKYNEEKIKKYYANV